VIAARVLGAFRFSLAHRPSMPSRGRGGQRRLDGASTLRHRRAMKHLGPSASLAPSRAAS
jgi:hypothetical protein